MDANEASAEDSGSPGVDASIDVTSPPPADAGPDVMPDHFDAAPGPPICNPDASMGTAVTAVVSTPDPDLLGAVTPDELVIAWTSLPEDAGPVVNWAERSTATSAFGPTHSVDPKWGPFPADHVGLSGDGLRIAFATPDQTQMVEISRPARGADFNAFSTIKDFVGVNPTGGADGNAGIGPFASPTFSPDYGIWAFMQGAAGLVVSKGEPLGQWSTPPALPSGFAPPASSQTTVIPTGWSADHQTLFYWDSSAAFEAIVWLDPLTFKFTQTKLLGFSEQYAYPSADCTNVYYSAPPAGDDGGADTLDIFVSPRL